MARRRGPGLHGGTSHGIRRDDRRTGNPVVATGELAGSSLTALAAIVAPLIALAAILVILFLSFLILRRLAGRRRAVTR